MTPEELVGEARRSGLDAVVITEHNRAWDPQELAQLSGAGLFVFGGVEVSTREGDCLVFAPELDGAAGPEGAAASLAGGPARDHALEELATEAHLRGGVAFLAHPFRTTLDQHRRCLGKPLDGLERETCNSFGRLEREAAEAVALAAGLHLITGSDAHSRDMVGCFYVELEQPVADISELIRELVRGAYRCRRNDLRFFSWLDARSAELKAWVRSEVLTGLRDLEALKRATGVSSDIIREVLADATLRTG
jgi:predicted metal-dependent phosphoesterase TrpH